MIDLNQLSITAIAFEQWRFNRLKPRERTPLHLRQQAVSLSNTYSSSKITTALKISGTQLKQWLKLLAPHQTSQEFIHLPHSNSPTIDTLNLELSFENGVTFSLNGPIPATLISTIIQEIKA
jgi:hypothetical protein